MRQRGGVQFARDNGQLASQPINRGSSKRNGFHLRQLPDVYIVAYLLLLCLFVAITLRSYWELPRNVPTGDPNLFSSLDARRHLEDIVALGIRHVGSDANEIHAVNLITEKVEEIQRASSRQVEIEVSLQRPSGHFFIDFPANMIQLYRNVTNVVVKLQRRGTDPRHALLINAHFDSALGSPAASDDAVSCATMLEILHCLAADPNPFLPDHAIIFLFNGAEETVFQASHGFITQHPWAKQVRAFLNLEAAGAGGKEIVFQTGPDHPWLAGVYARVVPHPFASVIAQEVFQSGIIPSDTDFRIFRDFGNVPGIDMAYFVNGYVYHTQYDESSRIPDGSIQLAGENVMSLVRELASSPLLADPGADKHGKVVFFDVLGLLSVVYPERIAIIVNSLTVLASGTNLPFGWSSRQLVSVISWLAAICINLFTALVLTVANRSMTWFTHTYLLLPLYIVPAVLAMAEVYSYWQKRSPSIGAHLFEQSCFHAVTLLSTLLLALLTYLRVCSAYFLTIQLLLPLIFRRLLWDKILHPALWGHKNASNISFVLCMAMSLSLSFMFSVTTINIVLDFFVPLTGRSGSVLPPDLFIGGITAVLVCITVALVVPFVVYTASKRLREVMAVVLVLMYVSGLLVSISGAVFPYSGGESPTPKRLFLQHMTRKFFNKDGMLQRTDSRIGMVTLDYHELKIVTDAVPALAQAQEWECDGVYCGLPYYFPLMKHIRRSWFLPAPKLEHYQPMTLDLLSETKTATGRRNFTFFMQIPKRSSIFISARKGLTIVGWSLEEFVSEPLEYGEGSKCHFIFYARGTGEEGETFWLEIEGGPESAESLEIAVAGQHLDPPLSHTSTLSTLLAALPAWVSPVAWTTSYASWVF